MSETRGATAVRRLVSAVTCGLVVGAAVAVPASAQEQGPSHHPSQHRRVLKAHLTGEKERPTAADPDAGGDGAVEPGGEDVRQHGQVEDLLQRLVPVGEPQQVPVGVRHEDVLRLATDPAAHVDVPVGAAGTVRG